MTIERGDDKKEMGTVGITLLYRIIENCKSGQVIHNSNLLVGILFVKDRKQVAHNGRVLVKPLHNTKLLVGRRRSCCKCMYTRVEVH